jgi:uncharacterized protein (TIGR03067 family)
VIELNKAKKGTKVRFIWKALDVAGSRNEEIKTIDYTTNSFENKVRGHLTLPRDWPIGKYRVEVYINESLDKTIDYTMTDGLTKGKTQLGIYELDKDTVKFCFASPGQDRPGDFSEGAFC